MKVLIVHNSYQHKGGEDIVVQNETELLKDQGVQVCSYVRHNDEIKNDGILKKASLLFETSWSKATYKEVTELIAKEKPDICHVHNFLPLVSPSVYAACNDANIPVIQTLHNYRLGCINGMFIRNDTACTDCLDKGIYNGVKNKCYRESTLQSYAVARMVATNNLKNTWNNRVDRFLCFTEFARQKFIQIGIDESKLVIKPNSVSVPESMIKSKSSTKTFLFVGRLDESKGIKVFIEAAKRFPNFHFEIAGKNTSRISTDYPNVTYHGEVARDRVFDLINNSHALIFPSLCFEGMPMSILEAFALKTPVIASNMGAMKSLINHKKTGLLFEPNDVNSLCVQLEEFEKNEPLINSIKDNAFEEYKNNYSDAANANQLINLYKDSIQNYAGFKN
ncbi:MAG: glycosyltransferase family 4 protein [Salibacteraceae bacterium]